MTEPKWSMCVVGGRAPKCENCGSRPSARHLSGISDVCKFLLCEECCDALAKELAESEKLPA